MDKKDIKQETSKDVKPQTPKEVKAPVSKEAKAPVSKEAKAPITKDIKDKESNSTTQVPANKTVVTKEILLKHGVHFGHKKNVWNPKMKMYIQGIRYGTHIINTNRTINGLNMAYKALYEITKKEGKVMFVGTTTHASEAIKLNAERSGSFYISNRWLGGTLTNFSTIIKSIDKYKELERLSKSNFEGYTKKEAIDMYKDLKKKEANLSGIKHMRYKPAAIILSSVASDNIALMEAKKLNIPVFAITDTNVDPDLIDYKIPGNDDANKSISLIITILADAICDAKGLPKNVAMIDEDNIKVLGLVERKEKPQRRYSSNNFDRKEGGYKPRRNFDSTNSGYKKNESSSYGANSTSTDRPAYKPATKPVTKTTDFKTSGDKPAYKPAPKPIAKPGTKPPVRPTEEKSTMTKLSKEDIPTSAIKSEDKTSTKK